jgi:hypothetical protein
MALIFAKSADKLLRIGAGVVGLAVISAISLYAYYSHPKVMETGYAPIQPVPYSHKLHAGSMGMDCYYCHNTVYKAAFAAVPATSTCMNCHTRVKSNSPLLAKVRESYASGEPVRWVQIHKLPEYVYFNHQAHLAAGVSCVTCHGRIDQMEVVRQVQPLSMSWCLDCHRNPAQNLRPSDLVTKLDWQPDGDPAALGREIIKAKHINPPVNCSGCHR